MTEKKGQKIDVPKRDKLTPNEELFVFYLLEGESRRRAYIKAYPNFKGDERAADSKAYKVFKRDRVRTSFEAGKDELARLRLGDAIVEGKRAEEEIKKIAYDNTAYEVKNEDGTVKEIRMAVPISVRLNALKELKKGADEILRVQAEKDKGESDGKIDITVSVRNEN